MSRSAVLFFVLVWTQFELGQFGILVNSFFFRVPLEFPYELDWFHDLSHELS